MNAKEYQGLAARTLIDQPQFDIAARDQMIVWNTLGLCGEAGEVVSLFQSNRRRPKIDDEFTKEFGDLLWYVAANATKMEVSLASYEAIYNNGLERYTENARFDLSDECTGLHIVVADFADYVKKGILHQHGFDVETGSAKLCSIYSRVRRLIDFVEIPIDEQYLRQKIEE